MEAIISLDYGILHWISENLVSEPLTSIMRFITTLGNDGFIWIALGLICLIKPSTRKCGVSILVALLFSLLFNNLLLKSLVARPRPFLQYADLTPLVTPPSGYSFPSGHSSSSFAAAFAWFMHHKKSGCLILVLAALIAFSRLYVCVHFPTDVLCGSLFGAFLGFVAAKFVSYFAKYFKKKN